MVAAERQRLAPARLVHGTATPSRAAAASAAQLAVHVARGRDDLRVGEHEPAAALGRGLGDDVDRRRLQLHQEHVRLRALEVGPELRPPREVRRREHDVRAVLVAEMVGEPVEGRRGRGREEGDALARHRLERPRPEGAGDDRDVLHLPDRLRQAARAASPPPRPSARRGPRRGCGRRSGTRRRPRAAGRRWRRAGARSSRSAAVRRRSPRRRRGRAAARPRGGRPRARSTRRPRPRARRRPAGSRSSARGRAPPPRGSPTRRGRRRARARAGRRASAASPPRPAPPARPAPSPRRGRRAPRPSSRAAWPETPVLPTRFPVPTIPIEGSANGSSRGGSKRKSEPT